MLYLSGKLSPRLVEGWPHLGQMTTPISYRPSAFSPTLPYAVDNGCFTRPQDFRLPAYLQFLHNLGAEYGPGLFATAPDVVGDAQATMRRSLPVMDEIRETGWPAALVAQDGLESLPVPWDDFDVLFVGGSTGWKLSHHAVALVHEAKARGKWTHQGRVNSLERLIAAQVTGYDSADGTYLAFGFDKNFPRLLGWMNQLQAQPALR